MTLMTISIVPMLKYQHCSNHRYNMTLKKAKDAAVLIVEE
jgi:hypothetical protein